MNQVIACHGQNVGKTETAYPLSYAAGLPRAVIIEAGEQPPRSDPGEVDPLKPHTWRPLMQPPKAGAVALLPATPAQGHAPAPLSTVALLAARGLSLLQRLFICAVAAMVLSCQGWA